MSELSVLYVPTDIESAWELWRANCGPCAVAAVLGREVAEVRDLFAGWPGYTNPTMIRTAMQRAGCSVSKGSIDTVADGLGFVQFEGPWEAGGVRAAYRHTHWVGLGRRKLDLGNGEVSADSVLFAYDAASGGDLGGWLPLDLYSEFVAPLYFEPKATGWRFRQVFEVKPIA